MKDAKDATERVLELGLALREYPILGDVIRRRMREEMIRRGVVREDLFEDEVKQKAIATQQREGFNDPAQPEPDEIWELRLQRVRDLLTDFYFANNLPRGIFHEIVADVLGERKRNVVLSLNPETAPIGLLFAQAEEFENGDDESRSRTKHHLKEIIVVLTKSMLSDQLAFVGRAREYLKISDLKEVNARRIGRGKIGGKAAGVRLAWSVLHTPSAGDEIDLAGRVVIPETWHIAADMNYEFVEENDLYELFGRKYQNLEQIRAEHEAGRSRLESAKLPASLVRHLDQIIDQVGDAPIIARSSSLLEDSFGTAFAGKYETYFCPNQGDRRERLEALCNAVRRVYASVLNPDALAYRKQMGLIDYDERMAILLQKVEGRSWQRHFFPQAAGVGFSHNPYRWMPQIDRKSGFLRMVWGLGTRAVARVERDHPRLVALSHPTLRPERSAREIQRYSQHFVDAIDLSGNALVTVPVDRVLRYDYPGLRQIASIIDGDELRKIHLGDPRIPASQYVITFDGMLQGPLFPALMRGILQKLERAYGHAVDIEFTVEIVPGATPDYRIHLLQCRPQAESKEDERVKVPTGVSESDTVFRSAHTMTSGKVSDIRYVVFVDPERYAQIPSLTERTRLARVVGRLNERLAGNPFIFVGPGRWGSSNPELGVPVTYADIFNADALVEVPISIRDEEPEASFGTHFFQDLVEANIKPVAVYPEKGDRFDFAFFRRAPNILAELLGGTSGLEDNLSVIEIPAYTQGRYLQLVLEAGQHEAVLAYLGPKEG